MPVGCLAILVWPLTHTSTRHTAQLGWLNSTAAGHQWHAAQFLPVASLLQVMLLLVQADSQVHFANVRRQPGSQRVD